MNIFKESASAVLYSENACCLAHGFWVISSSSAAATHIVVVVVVFESSSNVVYLYIHTHTRRSEEKRKVLFTQIKSHWVCFIRILISLSPCRTWYFFLKYYIVLKTNLVHHVSSFVFISIFKYRSFSATNPTGSVKSLLRIYILITCGEI